MLTWNEIQQDTLRGNWHSHGLEESSHFFYLLEFDQPEKLIKFGFKLSLKAFRDDYAKFNHYRPKKSYVWVIKQDMFTGRSHSTKTLPYLDQVYLKSFILSFEQLVHRKIKNETPLKKLPSYKEVYRIEPEHDTLSFVQSALNDFNLINFDKFARIKNEEVNSKWTHTLDNISKHRTRKTKFLSHLKTNS